MLIKLKNFKNFEEISTCLYKDNPCKYSLLLIVATETSLRRIVRMFALYVAHKMDTGKFNFVNHVDLMKIPVQDNLPGDASFLFNYRKHNKSHVFSLTIVAAFLFLGTELLFSVRTCFMPKKIILLLMSGFIFVGCTKIPKELLGQGMKIDYSVINNKEVYTINFNGVMRNENRNIVMKNIKGEINIIDPDSKRKLVTMPFFLEAILPMSLSNISLKTDLTEEEISPLLGYFNVDRNELANRGTTDGQSLSGDQVIIENIAFDKQDIIKLLKEKQKHGS